MPVTSALAGARGAHPNGKPRPPLCGLGRLVLSTGYAGKACQVSPHTVAKWIDRGLLPGHRLPSGVRRVRAADLLAFARAHEIEGAEARLEALCERRRRRWTH